VLATSSTAEIREAFGQNVGQNRLAKTNHIKIVMSAKARGQDDLYKAI
jgi:hypothetical protein